MGPGTPRPPRCLASVSSVCLKTRPLLLGNGSGGLRAPPVPDADGDMTPWSSTATRHMQGTENPDLERLRHREAWVGWVFSIYCGSGREEGGEMGSSKTPADRGRRQRSETTQKQAWGRLGAAGPAAGRDSRCFIKRGLGPWVQGRPGRTSLGQTREVPGPLGFRLRPPLSSEVQAVCPIGA